MKIGELKKKERGITLITLIITIILLLILAGVTIKFVVDYDVQEKAKNYTNKLNERMEEQQSLSNMVRNLYDTNSSK